MSEHGALQALADRQTIIDLIYRYCRAVDRLDVPLGRSVWHEDGYADYGRIYQGGGRDVVDHICAQHANALHHAHQVTNIILDIDAHRAASEAYYLASLRMARACRVSLTW